MMFGDYDRFEEDLKISVNGGIHNKEVCREIWSGLTNVIWYHESEPDKEVTYTFRSAGGLIADLRGEGHYMDWYMESTPGVVSTSMADAMSKRGWYYREYDE